jgi:hypothetical protein
MELLSDGSVGPAGTEHALLREPVDNWVTNLLLGEKGKHLEKCVSSANVNRELKIAMKEALIPLNAQVEILKRFPASKSWEGLRNNRESLDMSIKKVLEKTTNS